MTIVRAMTAEEEAELRRLADWCLQAELPAEPYYLVPGVYIANPELSHKGIRSQCLYLSAVPGQRRRALLARLKALKSVLLDVKMARGPRAGEHTPGSGI